MKIGALFTTILFLTLLTCQCAALGTKVEIQPVWQSDNGYIRLFREPGESKGHSQPVEFREEEMRNILMSLYFSTYQYFRWSTSSRIFAEKECRDLARPFQQAFLEAGPDDVVEFYLPSRAPKFLGVSSQTYLTSGRAFVKGGALHFRFDNVQMEVKTHATRMEDQGVEEGVAWKLVPQEGQDYDLEADILSSGRPNLHWLRISLKPLAAAPATLQAPAPAVVPAPKAEPSVPFAQPSEQVTPAPAGTPSVSGVGVQKGAREKLKELKQMLDDGLITQQDYDKKKKEILDSF